MKKSLLSFSSLALLCALPGMSAVAPALTSYEGTLSKVSTVTIGMEPRIPQLASPSADATSGRIMRRNVKGIKRELAGPSPADVIIENPLPELPRQTYAKTGWGWNFDGNRMISQDSRGSATQIVRDGETIYLSNPISLVGVPGWIEGTVKDKRISLKLPQYVQHREVITPIGQKNLYYDDYILALDYGEDEEGEWYFPAPEQEYVLIIQEDGSLIPEDETLMLGMCLWVDPSTDGGGSSEEAQWEWIGTGDLYWQLDPVDATPCQLPEGVELNDWNLVYNTTYFPVKVGFDGEDCYVTGLCNIDPDMADAPVKGHREGNTITFPTGQYFGISPLYRDVIYFMTGDSRIQIDESGYEFRKFEMHDQMIMTYDEKKSIMSSEDDYCTSVTMKDPYYYSFVLDPVMRINDPDQIVTKLLTPVIYQFYPQNDEYGLPNQILFILPDVSADYLPLDTERIFYQVFVEGMLFTFYPDEYTELKEEMTDVPYGFNDDWDFHGRGGLQSLFVAPLDIDELSVRSGYRNIDGSVVYSDHLYFLGAPNVGIADPDSEPIEILYYDMQGNRLAAPAPGQLHIRLNRFDDGKFSAEKSILR